MQNKCDRRIDDVVEHVIINRSYEHLIEVIRRNNHLILNYPQVANTLFPCDVISDLIYQEKIKK